MSNAPKKLRCISSGQMKRNDVERKQRNHIETDSSSCEDLTEFQRVGQEEAVTTTTTEHNTFVTAESNALTKNSPEISLSSAALTRPICR